MNVIDMTKASPVDALITTNNVPNILVSNNADNNGTTTTTIPDTFVQNDNNDATALPYILVKEDKKKKFGIPKIFGSKRNGRCKSHENIPTLGLSRSERQSTSHIEVLDLSNFEPTTTDIQNFRVFVATWNVGGKTPTSCLNLEDFLQGEDTPDIYVIGFQEVVPLSAGNVLVYEDSEPAAKWLALIGRALNDPQTDDSSSLNLDSSHGGRETKTGGSHAFSQKHSLKAVTRNFGADTRLLKSCNCPVPMAWERRPPARMLSEPMSSVEELYVLADIGGTSSPASLVVSPSKISYRLIACKQMVGIFLAVWARKELVQHIGHLRVSNLGRGVMGCLGNKGCISVSMTLHQTSFCFVCTHLASGEKEGDELRRNADVAEILKSTHFPKICRNPGLRIPERIIDHDRIIWLGDLNYRMALSYTETKVLLDDNNWDSLLEKDQLNIEREAGRVFSGTWNEGRILFAPTYKYTHNSDSYAGETVKSKKKRRTPSWCDRILWRGDKIEQLAYIRGESRFSDHRPVCAIFTVGVELKSRDTRFQKGYSSRFEGNDFTSQRHRF